MALLKKNLWLPILLIPLLFLFLLPDAYAQEEEMELDFPDAFVQQQRPAVVFPHELHMGNLDFLECHHDYDEDGENVLDEDTLEEGNEEIHCDACHDAGADVDLKSAFHKQCMGCHRNYRKAGDATGPELCGECHVKQK